MPRYQLGSLSRFNRGVFAAGNLPLLELRLPVRQFNSINRNARHPNLRVGKICLSVSDIAALARRYN
jgi:hypothetical protein